MKLHILGSGTCIPYERRGSSGYALRLSKSTILLDCGNGTTWKLGRVGINYLELDHIFLSHLHPDHSSDLIPFLFATKYATPHKRVKPLNVWGGNGFKSFFSSLNKAYSNWLMPDRLNIEEIKEGEMSFEDFKIIARKTLHIDSSLAYRIESKGRSLVYSGDTDYSESLVELSKNADCLLIECSMPDRLKVKGHLIPAEVSRIVNESRARKVIISHLYPISDELDVISSIRKRVEVEVVLAEDLLEVEI